MTAMNTASFKGRVFRTTALGQLVVPVANNPKGIIKVVDLERDVIVEVPKSNDMKETDSIQLYWDGKPYGQPLDLKGQLGDPNVVKFDLAISMADFPPKGSTVDAVLDYRVYDTDSEDGQLSGLVVTVRFDQRPPGGAAGLPPLNIDDELIKSGVTPGNLMDDPDDASKKILFMLVTSYFDEQLDDVIELWLGTSQDESSGTYLPLKFTVTSPNMPVAVWIREEDLRAVGDGTRYFAYRGTDWAGNVSNRSDVLPLRLFLTLPAVLAPLVPENDDGLITYNDANDPPERAVGVDIPAYPGAAAGDVLTVKWGTQTLPPYTLTASDITGDPLTTIQVPYEDVAAEGDGIKNVSYTMQRPGVPLVQSPNTPVEVNLTTPGGPAPDPDPTTPEHENIKAPSVQCGTSPVNTIQPDDYGKDAIATLFYKGEDGNVIWEVGDAIQLYWATSNPNLIPTITVTSTNVGTDIPITVPFAAIGASGTGARPVYFTLTRHLTSSAGTLVPVTVRSKTQSVDVISSTEFPGNGKPLAQGIFPEANARNIITRAAGIDGTTFQINLLGVSNIDLALNPVISYTFVGVASGDETDPNAPPIPGTEVSAIDVRVTQAMVDAGFLEVPLPYSLTYKICRNGAILDYSIANDKGRTAAIQKFVRFAMNQGGGGCSLP